KARGVARRFGHQARFVQELETVERALLVPWRAVECEGESRACPALTCVVRVFGPSAEARSDYRVDHRRAPPAPVFPWKEIVPGAPARTGAVELVAPRRECKITDRDHAVGRVCARKIGERRFAAAIAEGVELLDIADVEAGLLADPGPQR